MTTHLLQADARAMPLADNSVDAVVCDPPYDLTNRTPDVMRCEDCGRVLGGADGKPDACPRCSGTLSRQRSRQSAGFMDKEWDGTGVAFDPETWTEVGRVLKPGGHVIAFGGTRTFHRMTCAMEDAGFEIRDCLMWLYGSGFPKSKNIGDGRGTALKPAWEPAILARKPLSEDTVEANVARWGVGCLWIDAGRIDSTDNTTKAWRDAGDRRRDEYRTGTSGPSVPSDIGRWPANLVLDEVAADQLDQMTGELGSGTGIRRNAGPGAQPFSVSRGWNQHSMTRDGQSAPEDYGDSGGASRFFKVIKNNTVADSVSSTSCGEESTTAESTFAGKNTVSRGDNLPTDGSGNRPTAQFPADTKSTTRTKTNSTTTSRTSNASHPRGTTTTTKENEKTTELLTKLNSGGASDADDISRLRSLSDGRQAPTKDTAPSASVNTLPTGELPTESTTTPTCEHTASGPAETSRFLYVAKASRAERNAGCDGLPVRPLNWSSGEQNPGSFQAEGTDRNARNYHPTVKPVRLMRYLCRLVTPPGGTVLDCFLGSGSTGMAAVFEGFNFIGVEREREYLDIARARVAWALRNPQGGDEIEWPKRRDCVADLGPSLFSLATVGGAA